MALSTPSQPAVNGNPFRHLPALAGKIMGAEASKLRATDAVLAAWDAQAQELGLGPDWRLSNETLEASRRATLAQHDGTQDLWIFAYGSLIWDPGMHFTEVRRATLAGYQRRFNCKTTIGRGTVQQPGLVLALEPQAGTCQGVVFRIDAAVAEQETRLFWRREMIFGSYLPTWLPLTTPQGNLQALALVSNPRHPHHAAGLTRDDTAAIIRCASGNHGTNLDYLQQLVTQLDHLGIDDDDMRALLRLAMTARVL